MNKYSNFAWMLGICFFGFACQKVETTLLPNTGSSPTSNLSNNQIVNKNNDFAINLYRTVVDEEENQFLSPYSVSNAMAMVYAGANGMTANELQNVLGFDANTLSFHRSFNGVRQNIDNNLNSASNGSFSIVNKIWHDHSFTFLPSFENIMTTEYNAPIDAVDFGQAEDTRQTINSWVNQATQQLIPELLPQGFIQSNTKTVLVNALYFKTDWLHPFNQYTTSSQSFQTTNSTVMTDMMSDLVPTEDIRFTEDTQAEVLELFLADKKSSMVIVLPKNANIGLDNFVQQHVTPTQVNTWLEDLSAPAPNSNFSIKMPKWDLSSQFDIKAALSKMGVTTLFIPTFSAQPIGCDLTNMTEFPVYVENITHKAVIECHEGGVEAAASTAVGIVLTSVPPIAKTITADHPFVFFIRDIETNSILFIGHVQNPTAS